jgi:regulator of protease activity HflC (stomatin/prohibitin superfamily)
VAVGVFELNEHAVVHQHAQEEWRQLHALLAQTHASSDLQGTGIHFQAERKAHRILGEARETKRIEGANDARTKK